MERCCLSLSQKGFPWQNLGNLEINFCLKMKKEGLLRVVQDLLVKEKRTLEV